MKSAPMTLTTRTRAPFFAVIDVGAAAGRARRIVDRAQEAVVALGEGQRLALVPDMVAGGDAVGAGVEQLLQDLLGDAEAAGGVLAVDDDEVEAMLCDEAGKLRGDRRAARSGRPRRRGRAASRARPPCLDQLAFRCDAAAGACRAARRGTRSTSWQAKAMPASAEGLPRAMRSAIASS